MAHVHARARAQRCAMLLTSQRFRPPACPCLCALPLCLSVGELHEWFAMLALDGPAEQIFDCYEHEAFLNMRETVLLSAEKLVPLAAHPFRLPLQLECRSITRDSAVFGFSPTQPAHSWL